jgi:hypothetical protein
VNSRGTPGFWSLYSALPAEARESARRAYRRFKENPAHPGLQLERLRKEPRLWSVRVTKDYRAVARRYDGNIWVWVWIGNHSEFDRQFRG